MAKSKFKVPFTVAGKKVNYKLPIKDIDKILDACLKYNYELTEVELVEEVKEWVWEQICDSVTINTKEVVAAYIKEKGIDLTELK